MSEAYQAILQDLIDDIDNAGAVLIAFDDCSDRHGLRCGMKEFSTIVAKSTGRAKRRLAEIEAARASRICGVCAAKGDANHLGYCSESW